MCRLQSTSKRAPSSLRRPGSRGGESMAIDGVVGSATRLGGYSQSASQFASCECGACESARRRERRGKKRTHLKPQQVLHSVFLCFLVRRGSGMQVRTTALAKGMEGSSRSDMSEACEVARTRRRPPLTCTAVRRWRSW